jgi:hypothetical protein
VYLSTVGGLMVEEKEDIEEIGHLNVLVRACERRRATKTKVMMLFGNSIMAIVCMLM